MMSEGNPIGYLVIQGGAANRHARVEPIGVGEKVPLSGTDKVVDVIPAGGSHD